MQKFLVKILYLILIFGCLEAALKAKMEQEATQRGLYCMYCMFWMYGITLLVCHIGFYEEMLQLLC